MFLNYIVFKISVMPKRETEWRAENQKQANAGEEFWMCTSGITHTAHLQLMYTSVEQLILIKMQ